MENKVVVITGASAGIGAAAAKFLAKKGMSVVLTARRKKELDEIASRCGENALAVSGDMSIREDVRKVVDAAIAKFGHIDVWINNAGQGISKMPSQLTDEDIDKVMKMNVMTVLYGMQEVLPHFRSRNSGHIINISSLLGRVPFATIRSAYCGAKHFMNALTTTFRDEFKESHPGIQFSIVSPGVVRTEFGVNALYGGIDSRQIPDSQSAEEVAEVIASVIESRKPDVYTRKGAAARIAGYYASLGVDP